MANKTFCDICDKPAFKLDNLKDIKTYIPGNASNSKYRGRILKVSLGFYAAPDYRVSDENMNIDLCAYCMAEITRKNLDELEKACQLLETKIPKVDDSLI